MNSYGTNFRISIFGESHGKLIGVAMDGVPAGISLSEEDFMADLNRRRSGARGTTPRKEDDIPHIVSGTFEGCTTGAPLTVVFENNNTISKDYSLFREIPRPGHADFTAQVKHNFFNDIRGGGHFSGRLTLALVAAGVVAKKILGNIRINAQITAIAGLADPSKWDASIEGAMAEGDSVGGIIECTCTGIPAGLGEPFFNSLESEIAHLAFSIPGVRGIEFGDGFAAAAMKGSEHNDCFMTWWKESNFWHSVPKVEKSNFWHSVPKVGKSNFRHSVPQVQKNNFRNRVPEVKELTSGTEFQK